MATLVPKGQRLIILETLLERGQMTGQQLIEVTGITRGTIYLTLSRLELKGLVSSIKDTERSGRGAPHRYFEITAMGRQALEWSRRALSQGWALS